MTASVLEEVQTCKRFKGTLVEYDDAKHANIQGKPLFTSDKTTIKR